MTTPPLSDEDRDRLEHPLAGPLGASLDDNVGGDACRACLWFSGFRPGVAGLSCAAFPRGIPRAILDGDVAHTAPYPGDNGIRFQPRGVVLTPDDLDDLEG